MPPPRPEYPRPQFRRPAWRNLNGQWAFAVDDDDAGVRGRWPEVTPADLETPRAPFDRRITVPYCYQSALSGIGETRLHDIVWYARTFGPPRTGTAGPAATAGPADERVLLHFGAVDYWATVWVNGACVARHEGGHTPFSADITAALRDRSSGRGDDRENVLVVRAEDPSHDLTIPRGKQYWKGEGADIFYTPTTGIWQTVWLEPVPVARIDTLRTTPDVDGARVDIEAGVTSVRDGMSLRLVASLRGTVVADDRAQLTGPVVRRGIPLDRSRRVPRRRGAGRGQPLALWSPEDPNLYDLRVELRDADGSVVDAVDSYFGMRKIEARGGRVYLNNRPYYQRLVLDQGYFPGGLLTAPDDRDLRRDIELAKELGFNGARKHQKVEDPRWLYWADRLGFLVWGEMANAYEYTPEYVSRLTAEWQAAVRRDYNHPCVVAWVPVNESWGVPRLCTDPAQVAHLVSLYHLTRSLDRSRLIVSNDGWEHARSDLLTLHNYGNAKALRRMYGRAKPGRAPRPGERSAYVPGHAYQGEPVLITEFGGVALGGGHAAGWGYHRARSARQFVARYRALVAALLRSATVQGFCYTQLTDIEQEVNGLLTSDRRHKVDPAAIREITAAPPT